MVLDKDVARQILNDYKDSTEVTLDDLIIEGPEWWIDIYDHFKFIYRDFKEEE